MPSRYRMPYRALGRCLAAALVLFVGTALAQVPRQPMTGNPKADATADQGQSVSGGPPRAIRQQERAQEYKPRCNAPRDREEVELCSELRSNEIAKSANRLSEIGLYLNGLGFLALVLTLGATAWAAWAAGQAASLAQAAIEQSERHARQELRAYVSAMQPELEPLPPLSAHSHVIRVNWKNNGATPARRILIGISSRLLPDVPESDFDFPDLNPIDYVYQHAGPGGEIMSTVFVRQYAIEEITIKKRRLFVWAWIEYNDAFDGTPRRRTETCFEIAHVSGGTFSGELIFSPRHYTRFNGADEDCYHKPKTA